MCRERRIVIVVTGKKYIITLPPSVNKRNFHPPEAIAIFFKPASQAEGDGAREVESLAGVA